MIRDSEEERGVVGVERVYTYSHDYWLILIFIFVLPHIVLIAMVTANFNFERESLPLLFALFISIIVLLRSQYWLFRRGRTIFEVDQHGLRYPYMEDGKARMAEIPWSKIDDVQADMIRTGRRGARYNMIFYVESDVDVKAPNLGQYTSGTEFGVFKVLEFPPALRIEEKTNRLFVCKQFLADYRVKAGG
ncbi:MAG: hypothetical protein AAF431_03465 [Pseudomonadota bacterium]